MRKSIGMSTPAKVTIVTLVFGVPAFFLSRVIWPVAPSTPAPTGLQIPLFMLLGVLEALMFGLGAAFIAFGLPYVRKVTRAYGVNTWPVYFAIAWQLVSWWPHDNFHLAVGEDLSPLLGIEYGFHVTLMITGLVLARFFLMTLRQAGATTEFQDSAQSSKPAIRHGRGTASAA